MKVGTITLQAVEDFKEEVQDAFEDTKYAHTLAKVRQTAESGQHSKQPAYGEGD